MKKENRKPTTTDAGIPVSSDEYSLTVGPDGPILLQNHYLIEQMANFNRERIAERQPHAKGGGAFGHFRVTKKTAERNCQRETFRTVLRGSLHGEGARPQCRDERPSCSTAGSPHPDRLQKGTVVQSLSKRARRRIKTVIRARGLVRDDL